MERNARNCRSHNTMHRLDSPFVTDQLALRTAPLNGAPERSAGAYVLYWMQATHRFEENWALRLATLEADRLAFGLDSCSALNQPSRTVMKPR